MSDAFNEAWNLLKAPPLSEEDYQIAALTGGIPKIRGTDGYVELDIEGNTAGGLTPSGQHKEIVEEDMHDLMSYQDRPPVRNPVPKISHALNPFRANINPTLGRTVYVGGQGGIYGPQRRARYDIQSDIREPERPEGIEGDDMSRDLEQEAQDEASIESGSRTYPDPLGPRDFMGRLVSDEEGKWEKDARSRAAADSEARYKKREVERQRQEEEKEAERQRQEEEYRKSPEGIREAEDAKRKKRDESKIREDKWAKFKARQEKAKASKHQANVNWRAKRRKGPAARKNLQRDKDNKQASLSPFDDAWSFVKSRTERDYGFDTSHLRTGDETQFSGSRDKAYRQVPIAGGFGERATDGFDTSGERRAKEKQMMAHEMSLDDDNRGLDAWESVLNQYGPEAATEHLVRSGMSKEEAHAKVLGSMHNMGPMNKAFDFLKALNVPSGQTGTGDINPEHQMLLDRFSQTYNPRRMQTFTNPAGYAEGGTRPEDDPNFVDFMRQYGIDITSPPPKPEPMGFPTYVKEPVAPMVRPIMPTDERSAQAPVVNYAADQPRRFSLEDSLNNSTDEHLLALNNHMGLRHNPFIDRKEDYIENILRNTQDPVITRMLLNQIRGRDFSDITMG